jgi:hypothetical protein
MKPFKYKLAAAVLAAALLVVGLRLQHGPALAAATLLSLYLLGPS